MIIIVFVWIDGFSDLLIRTYIIEIICVWSKYVACWDVCWFYFVLLILWSCTIRYVQYMPEYRKKAVVSGSSTYYCWKFRQQCRDLLKSFWCNKGKTDSPPLCLYEFFKTKQ
jgi:hypothetical protein